MQTWLAFPPRCGRHPDDKHMKMTSDDMSQLQRARDTFLAIECPHCEVYNERCIEWLHSISSFACDGCGGLIDIASGQYRTMINALVASMMPR
jgi:ribosomal protein S27E